MSTKMIVGLFAIVVIIAGGAWYFTNTPSNFMNNDLDMTAAQMAAMNATSSMGSQYDTMTSGTASQNNTASVTPTSGTSDSNLNQDAANIDTQMSGLNSDNANADAGINSQ
jgi:hypothetical protein